MKSISYIIKYLMFVIVMFCAIFTPDFFSFSIRYLLVIICGGYLLWNVIFMRRVKIDPAVVNILKGLIPFLSYFILSQLIWSIIDSSNSDIYLSALIHTMMSFIGTFVICGFITCACKKLNLTYDSFLNVILIVMGIQLCCVLLALINPNVRFYFNSLIIQHSYSNRLAELAEASNSGLVDRSYGLSNNLFDSFGFITAMLILLLYNKGVKTKNNKILMFSLIMVIMPLVNARTGVLLLIIGFIVMNFYYLDTKNLVKNSIIIFFILIGFSQLVHILPQSMLQWLSSGLNDIVGLFYGEKNNGVFSEILGADLVFPNNSMLGAGGSPSSFNYKGIDNGYINCIWNFGIIGSVLLFAGYIHMFMQVYNKDNSNYYKSISILLSTMFFLYLIKIYPIDNFGINTIMFGVPSVILSYEANKSN